MRMRRVWMAGAVLALASLGGVVGCGGGGGGGGPAVAGGTVTGMVRNDLGEPVAGAQVSVGGVVVVTGADGSYRAANVPVGTHTLTVTAPGLAATTQQVTVTANSTTTADAAAQRVSLPPTVTVAASPTRLTFTGGVVDLTATVTDPDSPTLTVRGAWDQAQFEFVDQGGGVYTARVSLPGNATTNDLVYSLTATATDQLNWVTATATVTVSGLTRPSDVGGAQPDPGGGPPVPDLPAP